MRWFLISGLALVVLWLLAVVVLLWLGRKTLARELLTLLPNLLRLFRGLLGDERFPSLRRPCCCSARPGSPRRST